MSIRKQKTQAATPTPPYQPTDYERGVFDTLEILRQEVCRLSDAQREAARLLWEASPVAQSLLNFAGTATNIAGDVENRVVKRATAALSERRRGPTS